MSRLALPFGIILALTVALPVAASGGTHTQSFTDIIHRSDTTTDSNPCNGDTVSIQETVNGVDHVTFFPASDETWATFTTESSFTATDTGTGVVYTGHATFWGNFNLNRQNSNQTFTATIRATGSDGSTILYHDTMHLTLLPSGDVAVSFDKPLVSCG